METKPEILAPDDSALLRQAYLDAFVDTQRDHFKKYIRTWHTFSDGEHYEGNIWDCLRQPRRITFKYFTEMVVGFDQVFVFADDHSRDRVVGAPLWPYAPLSVARFQSNELLECQSMLPEDIYVFDSAISWTLVLTHECDQKRDNIGVAGVIPLTDDDIPSPGSWRAVADSLFESVAMWSFSETFANTSIDAAQAYRIS